MRFVADVGVSVSTAQLLTERGHDVFHLSEQSLHRLPDDEILALARRDERVILTFDLDFGDLLAAGAHLLPSVILFRLHDQTPPSVNPRLLALLADREEDLVAGALVIVEDNRYRLRRLPIQGFNSREVTTPEPLAEQDAQVRRAVYAAFAAGEVPTCAAVSQAIGLASDLVRASYGRLAEAHVLVLDPRSGEVWMAMPFSAVPTPFRVTAGETAWWANCAWDALGIAAATGRDVEIVTDCPDCGEPLGLRVVAGTLAPAPGIVHFAVPAAHWWDDIGYT